MAAPVGSSDVQSELNDGEELKNTIDKVTLFEDIAELKQSHADELAAVRKLLQHGQEEDDIVVYRFLKGYKFNVANAAGALDRRLKWRKENNIDAILKLAAPMQQKEFPYADRIMPPYPHNIHHGADKKGQPLSIERIGHIDPTMLVSKVTLEQFMEYHLYHMENKAALAAMLSAKTGKVIRMCKIMDLKGLGARHISREALRYMREAVRVGQDNYPEMLGSLYIVNAPWIFSTFWKMVKPMLQPMTIEKIHILASGQEQDDVLFDRIGKENLPVWLGGTCECDGGCVVEADMEADFVELPVKAWSSQRVVKRVPADKGLTEWEFRTLARDIAFGVSFFSAVDSKKELDEADIGTAAMKEHVVCEMARINSHVQSVVGHYEATVPGFIVLTFDNTYSKWTGKTVKYLVTCVSPAVVEAPKTPKS